MGNTVHMVFLAGTYFGFAKMENKIIYTIPILSTCIYMCVCVGTREPATMLTLYVDFMNKPTEFISSQRGSFSLFESEKKK